MTNFWWFWRLGQALTGAYAFLVGIGYVPFIFGYLTVSWASLPILLIGLLMMLSGIHGMTKEEHRG